MTGSIELNLGEHVEMRKAHPCGSKLWTIIRVGADIKLKCDNCGRILMMDRAKCVKSIKRKLGE